MSIGIDELQSYWRMASADTPLVIFGAGRWGRVWAEVATLARGSAESIAIVARSNLADTLEWQAGEAWRRGLKIVDTPQSALDVMAARQGSCSGLIASRPRDHLRDVGFCVANRLPAIVEKPFSDDHQGGAGMLARAGDRGVLLAMATEFSFLPALHYLHASMDAAPVRLELYWDDALREDRHGATKRPHEEVSVLVDVLPHALSMLREVVPQPDSIVVLRASLSQSAAEGWIDFAGFGFEARLEASHAAQQRRRLLVLTDASGRRHELDFSAREARLKRDARRIAVPPDYIRLDSVLRLELGAWQSALQSGGSAETPITRVGTYLRAHAQLVDALPRGQPAK